MTNSGFIAGMGGVAAAIFFAAAIFCATAEHEHRLPLGGLFLGIALTLTAVYLFVSLFWGVRATLLESFQVTKRDELK